MTNKVRIDRLRKLAKFLNNLHPSRFDITQFVKSTIFDKTKISRYLNQCSLITPVAECGTTASACGWLPRVFPDHFKYIRGFPKAKSDPDEYIMKSSSEFFGIESGDWIYLFEAGSYGPYSREPKDVANRILKFCKGKKSA